MSAAEPITRGGSRRSRMAAPDPQHSAPHSRRRRDVQGLRAVAILLVVAYHAGLPVPGGFVGVDVFFVISGFVITTMLTAELGTSGGLDLARFYVRRARRLLPALAVMLAVVLLLAALVSPLATQQMTAYTGMAAAAFAANAYLLTAGTGYFAPAADENPLLHTWTLGVEEQFYILFPLLLLAGWRLGGRRAAVGIIAGASAVSLAGFVVLSTGVLIGERLPELAFFGSLTRAWEFGVGALVAFAVPLVARLSAPVRGVLGVVGLGAVGLAALTSGLVVEGIEPLVPVLGTAALIVAGTGGAVLVSRLLSTGPAVWIGDLSYSWYLWHWPLIVFAVALWPDAGWASLAAAAVSLAPAWLSLRYVENPIRYGRALPGRRFAAAALACLLLPFAAAFGLLGIRDAVGAHPTMQSWERSQAHHADITHGCDGTEPLGERAGGRCTWLVPGARGEIVLVGDSNAGHFSEPVISAARRARLDLSVATYPGCPLVDVTMRGPYGEEGEELCRDFSTGTLAELVNRRPRLVIVAARSDKYIEDPSYRLRDGTGELTRQPEEKARLWEEGLARTLARLEQAGVPVLVVQPVPTFEVDTSSCTTLRVLLDGCSTSKPLAVVETRLRRALAAEDGAVAAVPGASAVDFRDAVCSGDRCSTGRGHLIMYRDGQHLSVDGALTLSDGFYRAIVAQARR